MMSGDAVDSANAAQVRRRAAAKRDIAGWEHESVKEELERLDKVEKDRVRKGRRRSVPPQRLGKQWMEERAGEEGRKRQMRMQKKGWSGAVENLPEVARETRDCEREDVQILTEESAVDEERMRMDGIKRRERDRERER
jgi:hypothetical protein